MAGRKPTPWQERFAEKIVEADGCMVWTGARVNGYGYFRGPDGLELAHKRMWKLSSARPHTGRMRNTCGNRACVKPEHWQ